MTADDNGLQNDAVRRFLSPRSASQMLSKIPLNDCLGLSCGPSRQSLQSMERDLIESRLICMHVARVRISKFSKSWGRCGVTAVHDMVCKGQDVAANAANFEIILHGAL